MATPRLTAIDGEQLRHALLSQLQQPYLSRITIVSYHYNDFDLVMGPRHPRGSGTALVRLLERAASAGIPLTLVTRDALVETKRPRGFQDWYDGLKRLHLAGATVRLHPSLHAKVYLFESEGNRYFFSVGSSNLTHQGMGYLWAECNVKGNHEGEYELVLRRAAQIATERESIDFASWDATARRDGALPSGSPPRQ